MNIARRDFLKSIGYLSIASMFSAVTNGDTAALERPNILWITTEDISPHLGCYGDDYAYTPTLDKMAKEGVLYTNAYATASVCTPARSSIITGMYASSLGTQHLRASVPLSKEVKCFSEYLRDSGYYCLNRSKTDYNFSVPRNAWDGRCDYWDGSWDRKIGVNNLTRHIDGVPAGKPFFFVLNFVLTHQSQTRYDLGELKKKNDALPLEARHTPYNAQSRKVPLPAYYPRTPAVEENIAAMYTQITILDMKVKYLLEQLERSGRADDTIVFFYSDHGDGLPRHKRWLYQSGTQVPFIIKFPKKYQHLAPVAPGEETASLINFVDLAPTMLSITGCDIPKNLPGKVFLGPGRQERKYTFAACDRIDTVYEFCRSVTDGKYWYVRNFSHDKPRMQWCNYSESTPYLL